MYYVDFYNNFFLLVLWGDEKWKKSISLKYSMFTKEEDVREGRSRFDFYLGSKYTLRKIGEDSFSLLLYCIYSGKKISFNYCWCHSFTLLLWLWHCITLRHCCDSATVVLQFDDVVVTVTFPQQKPINLAPRYHVASNLHSSRRSDSIEIITETDWWSCNSENRAGETKRPGSSQSTHKLARSGSNT